MKPVNVFRLCALGGVAAILSGCAGTAAPIRPYGYAAETDAAEEEKDGQGILSSAHSAAISRMAEWDQSIQSLQGANAGANTAIPALAGLVAFRAARQKSPAATAAAAATGVVGMNISDAMVQLSRINVYIEGIAALECAVYEYEAVGLHPLRASLDLERRAGAGSEEIALGSQALAFFDEVNRPLDAALGRAVSRVTRDVNRALSGSIVSVQSRSVGGGLSSALAPVSMPGKSQAIVLSGQDVRFAGDVKQAQHAKDAFISAVSALEASRRGAVAAAIAEIDKCSFGGVPATVEARPAPLALRAVGFDGQSVIVGKNQTVRVIVTGGQPGYSVELRPNDSAKLSAELLTVANAQVVELQWKGSAGGTENFTLFVSDDGSPRSTVLLPVQTKPD